MEAESLFSNHSPDYITSVFMADDFFSYDDEDVKVIAVGVSGGPDSMALCHCLSRYCAVHRPDVVLHILSVDHGLRTGSSDEVKNVKKNVSEWGNVKHFTLTWQHGGDVDARLQERARQARYDLMREHMAEYGVRHLFLAHHRDDQAETFLFRLAKGSGLDGLSCMSTVQEDSDGVFRCRPFLSLSKDDLITYCEEHKLTYFHDPSNDADRFARVRLRHSMDVLSEEGLTSKRLAVTAQRINRARSALDSMSRESYAECLITKNSNRIVFDLKALELCHFEIVLRVLNRAVSFLSDVQGYGVRLERLEKLCSDLTSGKPFRKRTLGGVIFEASEKHGTFSMTREHQ